MVATVGSISIDLSTNAAKFASGFTANAATVEQQSARMRKSIAAVEETTVLAGDKFKEFGVGLAAGTGLAAVMSLESAFDKLKETITQYDEIVKNSKTTGLRTDTYQALAFAARQADIDQETFNASLNIFAKNSGLAAKGTGALYSGLKTLNPQLLQAILNTKDQEERLKLVADAMANTSDATQKAALSTVIFGRGSVDMARILEQGRASIEEFKKTALGLGIIIPDELLAKAGELDEKLKVLSAVINANISESLIKLAPLLVGATEGFAGFSKELNAFSALVANFQSNPSLENFLTLLDQSRGTKDEGLITKMVDAYAKVFGNLGHMFTDATTNTSDESTRAIAANIQYLEDLLANLKSSADQGPQVQLEITEAEAKLKALQGDLVDTKAAGLSAANAISAGFAEAFRTAENASMDALAKMNAAVQAVPQTLPTVHRYGGDPNKIELPQFNSQSNVNGSGVGVTTYGGAPDPGFGAGGTQSNVNGSGVNVRSYGADPNTKGIENTSKYTQQTADNVSSLDANTKRYIDGLSSDIGGYSDKQMAQQTVAISKLSEVASWMKLNSYALAALVHNNDSGATGVGKTMFGDSFDSQYGSYISSWGVGAVKRPTVNFPTTSSDGTYGTSVNVQQPGNPITFVYNAAAGVSTETAKQQARDMYRTMTTEAARA